MVESMQADVVTIDLGEEDRLLLCTDGLTNMLSDTDIAEIMRGLPSKEACVHLVEAANNAGGRDNSTAVVIGRN